MVESNHLKHMKKNSTNLKLGDERKEFSVTLKNAVQPSTNRHMHVEKKQIKLNNLQPIDIQQESKGEETKLNHTPLTECSASPREYTLNKIIEKLKFKADQRKSTDIGIKIDINNRRDDFQNNIYNKHMRGTDPLTVDKTEGNLDKMYLQKNNKRLKINRTFEQKQTNLTQFYSVVKSVNVNSNEQNTVSEINNEQSLSNYDANNVLKNVIKESAITKSFTLKKANVIKSGELEYYNFVVPNTSDVTECKKTFDEVCDDILLKLARKRKLPVIAPDSDYKTCMLLKSFSTGDITEKENHENVNSVPVTECETRNANRQLESSKTDFDKFLEKIVNKIKHNQDNNIKPDVCKNEMDNNSKSLKDLKYYNSNHNNEKCYTELTQTYLYSSQFPQNIGLQSMEMHQDQCINENICHNTEICSMNTPSEEQNSNHNLSTTYLQKEPSNPINEFKNSDQQSTNTEILTSKRTNLINDDLANYNFVKPEVSDDKMECKKTFNKIYDSVHMKLAKKTKLPRMTPDPNYKTLMLLKSSNIGDMTEKGNHQNVNSVPTTDCETKNANILLESSKTEFDKFLERFLSKIEQNVNNTNNTQPNMHKIGKAKDTSLTLKDISKEIDWNSSDQNIKKCHIEPIQKYENSQFAQNYDLQSLQMHQNHCIYEDICLNDEDIYVMDTQCLEKEQGTSHNPSIANLENSVEIQIDLLDNDLEKSILRKTLKQYNTNINQSKGDLEPNKSVKLDNFIKNMTNIKNKDSNKYQQQSKHLIKRYKKGKTKIYRIKKLRTKHLQSEEINENLNFHDLLEKVTSGNYESQPRSPRYTSGSSISTPSSYITDETKSENLSTGSEILTSPQRRLRNGFNELSKDKSLCYSRKEWEDVTEYDKECIKMKLQDIFFQVLQDFKDKKSSYFKHRRQSFDNCIFKDGRLQLKPVSESSVTIISSKVQNSRPKFQLMLYIMKKIQTLLENNTKLTKREVYYQLKEFISDQRVSDRAINAISCLLDVGMWAFNITAQKGLVFGDLKLLLSSGEMLNCNIPGTLIPQDISAVVEIHSSAYFILVVEKESIFHKLIQDDLPNKLTRPFILITGKGFPDLNTQLFLKKLWMVMSIPVFILVDADPHGINIMLNYRFGSVKHAHVSQHLAVPHAKWLGVYPSEIVNLNIARQQLTEKDTKLVKSILATPYMEFSTRLVEELNILLTNKYKADIEGLMKTDSYLSQTYLPNKFFSHNFI